MKPSLSAKSCLRSNCARSLVTALLALSHAVAAAEGPARPPMLGPPVLVSENNYTWLEGARWHRETGRLLFSDPHGDTLYELRSDGAVAVVLTPTRKANNLDLDLQGRLVACEITGRVSRYSLVDGSVVDAVSDYGGHTLQFPNGLAILADGTIFFTDSKLRRIFRIDPAGRLHGALPEGSGDAGMNGLALSPDQTILYATHTQAAELRAFAVIDSKRLEVPRLLAKTGKAPDGLCVDREGNIYVGTAEGVQVFSSSGKARGVLMLPGLGAKDRVTKCVFGGTDGRRGFSPGLIRIAQFDTWRTCHRPAHGRA